ncbi:MAG: triose-phosphate isomerase [Deltaproteobacteria bacterium HGW-Deltaproteobacteria-14]|jgi:triosephosphate isomerase|nr:MAG: triose-phosphate isomerase [Deltaproteobacteria bacterium HGW-Deltaproteobacteria-14]
MTRRRIIAGNWKMFTDLEEAVALARGVAEATARFATDVDVVVIPPSCLIAPVVSALGESHVGVGAQNMHPEPRGAYTGELSGPMLTSVGCSYVVCGHSERRHLFGETSEFVGTKVAAAHRFGLTPILCVGETLEEREAGETEAIVGEQLRRGIDGLTKEEIAATIIAYEPVWAIGTGRTASAEQAQAVHAHLRAQLVKRAGAQVAEAVRIQYGGSVKPSNAGELLSQPDIDGALVGGASLKADSFAGIVGA